MSDSMPPPKVDPETLVLKASPRRVVRFKRNLLIGIAAAGCLVICSVTWMALRGSAFHRVNSNAGNLYNNGNSPTPDALAGLPSNYGQIPKPKPQLGPRLPGDLGPPIVEREQQLGLNPDGSPNGQDEADRAEQLRLAQQAQQANEAGVFFQLSQNAGGGSTNVPGQTTAPSAEGASGTVDADASHLNLDLADDQNDQQRKLDVVNQATADSIYNDHGLQTPESPYEILAGTIISASLITGLNSDLPGDVTAQVTENVYDTVTGRTLLIPQGSKLIGNYDSVVALGQSRALLVWQRLVMPDGSSIQIDNLPATDVSGYTGLEDQVDYHTWTLLKGVALSTLLGVGTETTFGSSQNNLAQAIEQSTGEGTNQAGQHIVEKDLNIQPMITVRPGWPLNVIVSKDIVLRPYGG